MSEKQQKPEQTIAATDSNGLLAPSVDECNPASTLQCPYKICRKTIKKVKLCGD